MIRKNAKQRYFCNIEVLSFSIKVTSNSRLFLDEFRQLTPAFRFITKEDSVDVEYRAVIRKNGDRNHVLAKDGEIVYETQGRTDLLLTLLQYFLNDFIESINGDYLLIHSAVLVKNGKAIILPATTKGGKSTLSIALVKNGFKYLSDEVAAVDLNTLRVSGFPRAIGIRKKTLSLFPSLEPEINHQRYRLLNSQKAREVHYGLPSKGKLASMHKFFPISAVVFPKYYPNGDTALIGINSAAAVFNLMRCSLNQTRLKEEGFRTGAKLVRQTKCYSLQMKDLSKACEVINSLI